MNFHMEHAKYKYNQITVTGWLVGDDADAVTAVWAEDTHGSRITCTVERTEREDVREAFFPQETECLFGFRIQFAAEEGKTYVLCLSDGVRVCRRKTNARQIGKKKRVPDGWKDELRMQLWDRAGKLNRYEEKNPSPYCGAGNPEREKAVYEKAKDIHVKFSFVIPAYHTEPEHLADMLESIWRQTYENWEICLADGSSRSMLEVCREAMGCSHGLSGQHTAAFETSSEAVNPAIAETLVRYLTSPHMKYIHLPENLGISGNTNAAFELADGDFVVMMDHDDLLTKDALECIARILAQKPEADFIYSDSDLTDQDDLNHYNPLFKPRWSPETLYSANYITHLSVIRTSLLREIGGWQSEYDGAQDWDLFLRIGEHTDRIYRMPRILYHWRAAAGSTALSVEEKPYAREAQLKAVQHHLDRMGIAGKAVFADKHSTCIRVELDAAAPLGVREASGERYASEEGVLIRKTSGVELSEEDAAELRAWASLPGIGVVSPRIVNGKGRIVSQGLILKENDIVALFAGCFPGTANEFGHTDWYRDHVAAEPVCYAVSRRVWEQIGGPDEKLGDLAMVDFCLRVEAAGYRNLMTPFVQVTGEESIGKNIRLDHMSAYKKLYEKYQPEEPV